MLFYQLPLELKEIIMLYLDIEDMLELDVSDISDYVLLRKKHKTINDAARNGNLIGLKYLIKRGLSFDIKHILQLSADNGHLEVVKYLIEKHNADIHADNDAALWLSARDGHLEIVKYLVEKHNADIHADNDAALWLSAENGHLEVVKYLVSKGADVHADNEYALWLSASKGHLEVVKYLEEIRGKDNKCFIL